MVAVLLGLALWQHELLAYGYMQAKGQLTILLNTRPVADVLADPAYPDSLKTGIRLVQEIKRFAQDSLGLDPSDNYSTFYDQHGKPLLWVLVGSEKYALKAVKHSFPIVGTFSYQGFFDRKKLLRADTALQRAGFDTRINEVAAYSTLGFFNDPILSSMLTRNEGSLAELIIHELTHGTLFVKDSLEYNENLADFVGDYGADRFMAQKYGRAAPSYLDYRATKAYDEQYYDHLLRGTRLLDKVYGEFKPTTPVVVKEAMKWQTIGGLVQALDTIPDYRANRLHKRRVFTKTTLPNNAYFVGFLTYRNQQNRFKNEFITQFNSDFSRYLTYLKHTYPSL